MWIDLIADSGSSRLTTRPSRRSERKGSTMAISPSSASSVTARALASSVATVPGSSSAMRVSILPPSRPLAARSRAR